MSLSQWTKDKVISEKKNLKQVIAKAKEDIEDAEIADTIVKMLPQEIQEMNGFASYLKWAEVVWLFVYGDQDTKLVFESYGFVFGKPYLNKDLGKFQVKGKLGFLEVTILDYPEPLGCEIREITVTERRVKYEAYCGEGNKIG